MRGGSWGLWAGPILVWVGPGLRVSLGEAEGTGARSGRA